MLKGNCPKAQKTAIDTLIVSLTRAQAYDGLVQERIKRLPTWGMRPTMGDHSAPLSPLALYVPRLCPNTNDL
jgi:hypothetical protein